MFGLTRREQRWAAEQRAAELFVTLAVATIKAKENIVIAKAKDDSEVGALRAEVAELKAMLAAGEKP